MALGVSDKIRPLIAAVGAMVRDEILPLEEEYDAEIGREGDRFKPTKRMVEQKARWLPELLEGRARALDMAMTLPDPEAIAKAEMKRCYSNEPASR